MHLCNVSKIMLIYPLLTYRKVLKVSFLGPFLLVTEPPVRFKQPLNDLQVWERDLAVLECEVPEDSVPITWYLEDRRLQPGAKYGMEEWGTKRRLTIRDIGVDDDGIYLCEMADGGRSIAEVAVKGKTKKKLAIICLGKQIHLISICSCIT